MFYIIAGIVEGFFAGLLFNWVVFNLLLGYGKSKPEWLLMMEVIIVIVFTGLGFLIATWCLPLNGENSDG